MAPLTTSRVLSNYAPIGAGRRTSSFKALGVTDTAAPTYLSFTRPWHKVYFGLFYLLQHLTSKANIYPGYVNGFILWLSKSELHRMSLRTSQVRGCLGNLVFMDRQTRSVQCSKAAAPWWHMHTITTLSNKIHMTLCSRIEA